jgi:hypothetical protein
MGIPADTYRVVLSGRLSGGEIFETGFWVQGSSPDDQPSVTAQAGDWATFFGGSQVGIVKLLNTTSQYDKVTVYSYPTGGPHAAFIGEHAMAPLVGTGTQNHGDQTCLVMTLRTGQAGRRHRGRMFLPANGCSMDGNALVTSSQVSDAVDALAGMFTAYNGPAAPASRVVVVSSAASAAFPVTSVDADLRPDVQRRRANKQTTGVRQNAGV